MRSIWSTALALVVASSSAAAAQEGQELPLRRIPNIGESAELYFSPDGRWLIGSVKQEGDSTHHVYTLRSDGTEVRKINDKGEDACSYFFPDMKRILWTSTRDNLEMPKGNWSDANDYPQGSELYSSKLDGSDVKRLTKNAQYDAEASMSPDGKWIVFTRMSDGKLDLWRMRSDGTGETQVTRTDDAQEGGSFYLPDSETIIYRAWSRADQAQRGRPMTIYTIKHDGSGTTQISTDPGLNWAPHPAPDGVHFAYVRMEEPGNFDVFVMNMKTKQKRQLTFSRAFDGYPSFSPDGKTLAFASSRDAKPGERKVWTYLMDVSSLGIAPLKKK
jgi:Tol biopolymer transport system component